VRLDVMAALDRKGVGELLSELTVLVTQVGDAVVSLL